MKSISLCLRLVFCLCTSQLSAQFDLLSTAEQTYLATLPFDTMRVDTLNEWAYLHESTETRKYAQAAMDLAQKIGYNLGIGDSNIQLGSAAADMKDFERAVLYYRAALKIRIDLKLLPKAASCYNQIGLLYKNQGHYEKAVKAFQEGLKLMKSQPPHINTGFLYNNLGTASRLAGLYETADTAFKAGLELYHRLEMLPQKDCERRDNRSGRASIQLNRGAFLQESRFLYEDAKALLLHGLEEFKVLDNSKNVGKGLLLLGNNAYYSGKLEEAKKYYEEGIDMQGQITENDYYVLVKNRGRVSLDQRDFRHSWSDFQVAMHGFLTLRDTPQIAATHFEIGKYYYEQSVLDSAIWYFRQTLAFNTEDVLLNGLGLFFLSDALDQLGSKEAPKFTNAYVKLLNGLNQDQKRGVFETLNRIVLDKTRFFRHSLELDKRLLEKDKQSQLLYGFIGLSILALTALFFYLKARLNAQKRRIAERNIEIARQREELARQNESLALKNEKIAIQEKIELLQNRELDAHFARLEGQETMQKEIGKELHDGLGNILATVKLNLAPVDEVLDKMTDAHRVQYSTANRLLDEVCVDLRRIAHQLESHTLLNFGLKAALEALEKDVSTSGKIKVELSPHGLQERLNIKMESNLYRIVQELVNNVIKHAKADKITIEVNRFENMLNVLVADNGQGFDLEKARQKPGVGMFNLEARVHSLKGKMFIDTKPGRGTTVSIDIPVFQNPD